MRKVLSAHAWVGSTKDSCLKYLLLYKYILCNVDGEGWYTCPEVNEVCEEIKKDIYMQETQYFFSDLTKTTS